MAATKKGIRVNELAKELGVESKAILTKLRDEGLGDQAPNHQSSISIGLAMTIRDWHAEGALAIGGGTATATAVEEPPARSHKAKRPPARKKKAAPAEKATPKKAAKKAAAESGEKKARTTRKKKAATA